MNPIQIAALTGLLFSLPAAFLGLKRVYREKDSISLILCAVAAFVTATFISAYFHDIDFIIYMINPDNLDWSFNPWFFGIPLIFAGLILDGTMFLSVKKITYNNLWRSLIYLLCAFVGINLLVGAVGSMFTSYSFDQCFFGSCCASMGIAGFAWGLTYKEICVIGNLYMQSGIFLFTVAYLIWVTYKRYRVKKTIPNMCVLIAGLIYLVATFVGFCWVLYHYPLPLESSYDKCYHELVNLTHTYGISYNDVNYLIFIVFYLVLVMTNLLLAGLLQPKEIKYKIEPDELKLQTI